LACFASAKPAEENVMFQLELLPTPSPVSSPTRVLRGLCAKAALAAGLFGLAAFVAVGSVQAADTPIAEAASVKGQVEAVDMNGQVRALHVGDPVFEGESVRTGAGASAGLWHDEALAQLAEKSRARVDRNALGQVRVTLEDGSVRVVDPRETGAPIELVALDSSSTALGGDREARILREKAGAYAMLCDWVKPIAVTRRAEGKSARPGDCIIAHPREPLFASPGHDERIPLLAGAPALADAGPAIDPASLIEPLPPVGAPGPGSLASASAGAGGGPGLGAPGINDPLNSACTTVGAGCLGGKNFIVVEPPPTDDPFPGGGGFPGDGGFPDGDQ
jgi:hypothetical protein